MRTSYWLSDTSPLQGDLNRGGAQSRTAPPPSRSLCCCCFRACLPAMASLKDLEGRWRLTESQGFEEYMKELGVGLALRKMGAMAKPDCIITCDGNNVTVKTESTLKTTQFSCTLGEKFDETTADGRKTQTICTFTDGALVQHQNWDGKESTITRKVKDGKLVVDCVMNNVTCTRVYEKVE